MADQTDDRRHNDLENESIIPADELYDLDISLDDPEEPHINDLDDLEDLDELEDLDDLKDLDDLDLDDLPGDNAVDNTPAEEAPVEEAPVEETPVENAPPAQPDVDPEDALAAVFDHRNRVEERDELDLPTSSLDDDELPDFLDEDLEDLDLSLQELDAAPTIIRSPDELDKRDDFKREPVSSGYSGYNSERKVEEAEPEMPNSKAAETKKGFSLNMADSISMSMGLVALLIAAIALWLAMDSSGEVTALQGEPKKIEKRLSDMEQQQTDTITDLTRQIETLQQQLNDLTQVIASKSTQQWQSGLEQKNVKPGTAAAPQGDTATMQPIPETATKAVEIVKPEPIKTVVAKPKIKALAPYEVDLNAIKGWTVNLQSLSSEKSAVSEVKYLREKDIKAEFGRFSSKGRTWFRVLVQGFEKEHQAIAYKKFLKDFHNIDAWHHKMP